MTTPLRRNTPLLRRQSVTGSSLGLDMLDHRSGGNSVEAELVALGVLHDNEAVAHRRGRLVALEPGRAQRDQARALGLQGGHPRVALQPGRGPDVEAEGEREVGVQMPFVALVEDDGPSTRHLVVGVDAGTVTSIPAAG